MQVSKLFPAVIAVLFSAGLAVRADDSPSQAAARAALLEKMSEINVQQNSAASAPVVVDANGVVPSSSVVAQETPAPAAPAEAPATETAPPAPAEPVMTPVQSESPAPVPVVVETMPATLPAETTSNPNGDNPAQAAARAALMEQMNGTAPAAQPSAPAAVEASPAPVPAKAPAVMEPVENVAAATNTPATVVEPALVAPKPAPMPVKSAPAQPASAAYAGKSLGLQPIVAPELPISATKEARLQALLQQYKADQLTPEQYHAQRAAILAEP